MYYQLQLRGDMRQVTKIRSALLNCMTAKSCMSVVENTEMDILLSNVRICLLQTDGTTW